MEYTKFFSLKKYNLSFIVFLITSLLFIAFNKNLNRAYAEPPAGCPGSSVAGPPTPGSCEIYSIQIYLASQICQASISSTPDNAERAVELCREQLKDEAEKIANTCGVKTDPAEGLKCLAEEGKKVIDDKNGTTNSGGGQNSTTTLGGGQSRQTQASDVKGFYSYVRIIMGVIGAAGGLAIVGSFVIAGFRYATAGDDSGAISRSKQRIVFTLIALIIYLMLYSVVTWLIPSNIV